jgi:3-hydroxybutyryl-CoA dehydrogenase
VKKIENIGVIGEGKMGSSIFLYLNSFDFKLTWICSSAQEAEKARKTFVKKTRFLFQSGILTEAQYNSKSEKTTISCSHSDLSECDLIIEAITENADTKRLLFSSLDRVVNSECIFTSNSSSIIPSQMALSELRSQKMAGLHFFFPVPYKKTVELIISSSTSLQTQKTLNQFLLTIDKKPFTQSEGDAFVLNRLLLDYQAVAFQIADEGKLSYREIDLLVKQYLFPVGVFEFFDHVGIDIMLSSIKSYTLNSGNLKFYSPLLLKLEEMVRLNHLGIKERKGFYDYPFQEEIESSDSDGLPADYEKNVIGRLKENYLRSVASLIDSGISTREDLTFYLKDYLGIDSDPLTLD